MDNRDRGDIGEIKFIEFCVKNGYNVTVYCCLKGKP